MVLKHKHVIYQVPATWIAMTPDQAKSLAAKMAPKTPEEQAGAAAKQAELAALAKIDPDRAARAQVDQIGKENVYIYKASPDAKKTTLAKPDLKTTSQRVAVAGDKAYKIVQTTRYVYRNNTYKFLFGWADNNHHKSTVARYVTVTVMFIGLTLSVIAIVANMHSHFGMKTVVTTTKTEIYSAGSPQQQFGVLLYQSVGTARKPWMLR
ncbi:DUF4811 domain-containing protein|uniref:DUF4811 domain-containing protein n=1 Tax=Leuconostoc lactis TaxID=1246 RepID=A0A6L7AC95_LEULA|nr:DUF4811 domain-containing protein [Leuconostoc lactis]